MKKLLIILIFFITSCSIPKIIILEDKLTAEQHNDLGVIYEKKGEFNLAEKEYKKAIEKNKNWYLPYFNLGNLYYKIKNYEKAKEYYEYALKLKPDNPDILNNLAYLLYEMGDYKNAKIYIEKALSIDKKEEYIDTYKKIMENFKE